MNTILGLLFVALLVYLAVTLVRWPIARQQGRNFDLRRAKLAGVVLVALPLIGVVTGADDPASQPRAVSEGAGSVQPQASPAATSTVQPTPDPAAARALEAQREAEREATRQRRLAVAARKAANRERARAQRAVRERKAANRAKARAQNRARAAEEAREQAASDAATGFDSSAGGGASGGGSADYAGMNCTEIGHSFEGEPGSDPDHDADNDGVACESQ